MAPTEAPAGERRRSPRLLERLRVRVVARGRDGEPVNQAGEAVVISAHGALLKTPEELRAGTEVEVENPATHARARFRVIWATAKPLEGCWDAGVELSAGQAPWANA